VGYSRALVTVRHPLSPTLQPQPLHRYFLQHFSCATQRSGLKPKPVRVTNGAGVRNTNFISVYGAYVKFNRVQEEVRGDRVTNGLTPQNTGSVSCAGEQESVYRSVPSQIGAVIPPCPAGTHHKQSVCSNRKYSNILVSCPAKLQYVSITL
jgi:hypothetical protein